MADLKIKPWALENLEWSRRSPQEGEPDCTCMLCGEVIGVPDDDPRKYEHEDYCTGCPVCDIALRMWRGKGKNMVEQRYHVRCFEKVLAPNPTLGPVERSV